MNSLTVFIGRFSPFHNGHAGVLSRALLSSSDVLVLIGSSGQARSIKNPFTYYERKEMIEAWYNENSRAGFGRLWILPSVDYPYNDQKWVREIQTTVLELKKSLEYKYKTKYPAKSKLTGANRDNSCYYLDIFGGFFDLDLVQDVSCGLSLSATEVRTSLFEKNSKWYNMVPTTTARFLNTMNHAVVDKLVAEYEYVKKYKDSWKSAPFPPTFMCVDACVVQSGHVLVVERKGFPGDGLWALPGGFLGQEERLVDAAIRELQEETDIEMAPAQLYGSIKSMQVFDDPGRSTRGRTLTACYLLKLQDSKKLPKVRPQLEEVSKVLWVPIAEAQSKTEMWYEDHHAMMCTMIDRI